MWWIPCMNFVIFSLSKFKTILLAANHLILWERTKFDTEQKYLKLMLEIMTPVSSANNIGSDIVFIIRRRSFIYIMNNRGPWGTAYFNVVHSDKKF
jgi:hypothetical protein